MKGLQFLTISFFSFIIFGCSEFRKIQRSGDWNIKYEAAVKYYNEEKYDKSIILFENIKPIIRGSEKDEIANYYLAYSYYYEQQYILSAYQFEEFVKIFGRSEYAMEAMFMHAYSLYLQSPLYKLDQTSTYEAIVAMQKFLDKYPSSEFAQQGNDVIDELQVKLERKAYEQCKLYYRISRYKAAIVVFKNFKNDYPDSKFNEEIAFLNLETHYNLAKKSTFRRQEERYNKTAEVYLKFIETYPESTFLKQAEKIYAYCIKQMTIFANSKN